MQLFLKIIVIIILLAIAIAGLVLGTAVLGFCIVCVCNSEEEMKEAKERKIQEEKEEKQIRIREAEIKKEQEEKEEKIKKAQEEKEELIKIFNEDKRTNTEKLESARAYLISNSGFTLNIVQACIVGYQYVFTISLYGGFYIRTAIEKTKDGYREVVNYSVS